MKFKEVITTIQDSPEYKEFLAKNPSYYLVHLFTLIDHNNSEDWQVGYYSKESDKIVVFNYHDSTIAVAPEQEAFKEKKFIEKLDIDNIDISKQQVMQIIEDVMKTEYKAESLMKAMILLQNLPEFGQIWNITLATSTFHVINIKIDAKTGEVLKKTRESLLQWKK